MKIKPSKKPSKKFRVPDETTAKRNGWDSYWREVARDTLSQEVSQDVKLRKGLKQTTKKKKK